MTAATRTAASSPTRESNAGPAIFDADLTRPRSFALLAVAFLLARLPFIGYGYGSNFTNTNNDRVGTRQNPLDPRLAPLAYNGGPTRTHALLRGSPALDSGDNTLAQLTDQRGVRRARDGDGDGQAVVDIGAFER